MACVTVTTGRRGVPRPSFCSSQPLKEGPAGRWAQSHLVKSVPIPAEAVSCDVLRHESANDDVIAAHLCLSEEVLTGQPSAEAKYLLRGSFAEI